MDDHSDESSKRAAQEMSDCDHLFIRHIRELDELELELLIDEAKPQEPILTAPDESDIGKLLVGGRPIETDHSCRMFRVMVHAPNMVY